jgi:ATP-dependent Lhr-like helicase
LTGRFAECLESKGYRSATRIQREAFNIVARQGKSIIIVAPTGTGKTEAAVFPVMYSIVAQHMPPISAIYISPLRALNRDLYRRLESIGECFHVSVGLRHGDTSSSQRKRLQDNPPQLLITTPETFGYLLINSKTNKFVKNIKFIIIDEFRELMESKRGTLLFTLIHLLEEELGRRILKIALTATLSNTGKAVSLLNDKDTVILRDNESKKMQIRIIVPDCRTRTCRRVAETIGDPELQK